MAKKKEKDELVCVGWAVVMNLNGPGEAYIYHPSARAETEEEAIDIFNKGETSSDLMYDAFVKRGLAIAKELWVKP